MPESPAAGSPVGRTEGTPSPWKTEYQRQFTWKAPLTLLASDRVTEAVQTSPGEEVHKLTYTAATQSSPVAADAAAQTKGERVEETATQTTARRPPSVAATAATPATHTEGSGQKDTTLVSTSSSKGTSPSKRGTAGKALLKEGVTPEILSYGAANVSGRGGWADKTYMKTFNTTVPEPERMPWLQERVQRTRHPERYQAEVLEREAQALESYRRAHRARNADPAYQSEYQRQYRDWSAPRNSSTYQQTADIIAAASKEAAKRLEAQGPPAHTLPAAGLPTSSSVTPAAVLPTEAAASKHQPSFTSYMDTSSREHYPRARVPPAGSKAGRASRSTSPSRPGSRRDRAASAGPARSPTPATSPAAAVPLLRALEAEPPAGITHAMELKWREKRHYDVDAYRPEEGSFHVSEHGSTPHLFDTWNLAQELLERSRQRSRDLE